MSEEPDESDDTGPAEWLAAAQRHANAGDLRKAYRAAFRAILLQLDRAGHIRFERGRTNGEYLRALRGHPQELALIRPVAADFDAVWYGRAPVCESDLRACFDAYERLAAPDSGI